MSNKFYISFALFSTVLIGSSFGVYSAKETKAADSKIILDYSTNANTKELSGSELLEKILEAQNNSDSVCQAESAFLDANFAFKCDALSNSTYNIGYIDNFYWVEAFEDENYIPKYLSIIENNVEKYYEFSRLNKQLIARAPSLESAKIVYESKVNVTEEDANTILHKAYLLGKGESENIKKVNQYVSDLTNYNKYINEDLPAYNQYLIDKAKYDLEKANYDQYLIDKAKYDEDSEKYAQYLIDKAAYNQKLAEYSAYLEQLDIYNKNKDAYGSALKEYNEKMATIDHHLAIMDILFEKMGSLNTSIAEYIDSDSVETVIERRSEIVTAGVEGTAVDLAGEKTNILRPLINEYKEICEGTKQEKYVWYQKHYISFRNAITTLTKCLEYFYTISIVRSAIEEKNRTQKYVEFVAELIYFCEAINDSEVKSYQNNYVLDGNRKIGGLRETYPELLGIDFLDTTLSSYPLKGSYPAIPGEAVIVKPEEVAKPVAPVEVKKPIEPSVVEEPNSIEEVAKPTEIIEPTDPQITLNPELESLATAFDAGLLYNRKTVAQDITITINETVDLDLTKVKDVVALCDTTKGTAPGTTKVREFIYFTDPADAVIKTSVPIHYGVFSSNEAAISSIFSGYGIAEQLTGSLVSILDSQKSASDSFEVTWKHVINNEFGKDFEEIGYQTVNYGYELYEPSYSLDGKDPSQADVYEGNVRKYSYVFVGYDYTTEVDSTKNKLSGLTTTDAIVAAQGETTKATINVVFDKVECFDVTVEGHAKVSYLKGTKILEPEDTPSKAPIEGTRYMFVGWSANGSTEPISFPYTINETTVLTPIFKAVGVYQVYFEVDGKTISSQRLEEGSMPTIPQNVAKERTDSSYFIFDKWDKEVTPVNGNVTYVAQFIEKPIVVDADIKIGKQNVVITSSTNSVSLKDFMLLSLDNSFGNKGLEICFANGKIVLNKSQISYLASVNADVLTLIANDEGNGDISYLLSLVDSLGNQITNDFLVISATVNVDDAAHAKAFDEYGNEKMSLLSGDSSIDVSMKIASKIKFVHYYKISFDKYMSAVNFKINGEDAVLGEIYEFTKGTEITIAAEPKLGVELDTNDGANIGLFTNDKDGYRHDFISNTLIVGDQDMIIYADINRTMCTVNLYVDGVIYQTIIATYGSLVNLPMNISKTPDAEYIYVFVGWDKEISIIDGNYEIEAMFEEISLKESKEDDEVSSTGLTFGQKVSIGALTAAAAVIAGAVIIVAVKNRKKPQK